MKSRYGIVAWTAAVGSSDLAAALLLEDTWHMSG